MIYAILYHPGHNRVYFETSIKLSVSEFQIVVQGFQTECQNVQRRQICGVEYLTFETSAGLSEADVKKVFGLSFVYALFQLETMGGETYLRPVQKAGEDFVDGSIGTILKYTGKTNELFTRMLLNIAASSQSNTRDIRVLDPIAGKGTTLYEGLVKGFDVYGIEIGAGVVNEAYHFVKKFLETARYKFEYETMKISGPNKSFSAVRHTFQTARSKEEWKAKRTRTIEFIAGNSQYADAYFKRNFFDMIVGDLPYGVQHGNVTNEKQSSLTRNPAELLNACLPAWLRVLKPLGTVVLAWNSNVLPRNKMERLCEDNGLTVKRDPVYLQFEHRVDQSILRDIIVAQKRS